jgi:hypothetical protein
MGNYRDIGLSDMSGGINLRAKNRNVGPNESPNCYNIDIIPEGGFVSSNGSVALNTVLLPGPILGARTFQPPAGREQTLFASGSALYKLNSDGTYDQISTEQQSAEKTTFIPFNGYCLIMNGADPIRIWDGSNMATLTQFPGDQPTTGYPSRGIAHKNKLWLTGDKTNPSAVYVSEAGNHAGWTEDSGAFTFDLNRGDGEAVTTLYPFFNYLVGYKPNSIYAIEGAAKPGIDASDEVVVRTLHRGIGCNAPDCVVNINNDQLFVSGKTIRTLQNTLKYGDVDTDRVSKKVQPLLSTVYTDRLDQAFVIHYSDKDEAWFFLPTGSSGQNNTVLVLNGEIGSWTPRKGFTGSCGFLKDGRPHVGTYDGKIVKHDFGGNYEGELIDKRCDTFWNHFGSPQRTKHVRHIDITAERYGNWNLPVYTAWDYQDPMTRFDADLSPPSNAALWGVSLWGSALWSKVGTVQARRIGAIGYGKTLQLSFRSNSKDQPFYVQAWDISVEPRNYRPASRREGTAALMYAEGMNYLADENGDYIVGSNDEYLGVD